MGLNFPSILHSLFLVALRAAPAIIVATLIATTVYRLALSPLAKFPGPKIAALTSLYEFYYDCVKDGGGRYYKEIERMHEQYGKYLVIMLCNFGKTRSNLLL